MDVLIKLQSDGISRKQYTVIYGIKMTEIMIDGENVEERFRNSYQMQVQYFTNRVMIRIIGIQGKKDIFKHK